MSYKIIHLSDLHFGKANEGLVPKLEGFINDENPDLVLVSGDFTQSGTREEFRQTRDFLERLPAQIMTVPGNHDMPVLNLFARFLFPFKRYKEYIDDDLCPTLTTDNIALMGLNSARRAVPHWNWANGKISNKQAKLAEDFFAQHNTKDWKICTLHHPIHEPSGMPIDTVVFGGGRLLRRLKRAGCNLVLTGHLHHANVTSEKHEHGEIHFIGASTAISTRLRKQYNGFNVLTFNNNDTLDVTQIAFDQNQLKTEHQQTIKKPA